MDASLSSIVICSTPQQTDEEQLLVVEKVQIKHAKNTWPNGQYINSYLGIYNLLSHFIEMNNFGKKLLLADCP